MKIKKMWNEHKGKIITVGGLALAGVAYLVLGNAKRESKGFEEQITDWYALDDDGQAKRLTNNWIDHCHDNGLTYDGKPIYVNDTYKEAYKEILSEDLVEEEKEA